MLITTARTLSASNQERAQAGRKLLIKLCFEKKASDVTNVLLNSGLDQHLLVKEDGHTELLTVISNLMGISKVML